MLSEVSPYFLNEIVRSESGNGTCDHAIYIRRVQQCLGGVKTTNERLEQPTSCCATGVIPRYASATAVSTETPGMEAKFAENL